MKKAALFVFLLVVLLASVVIADDLASLKSQYAAQKIVSERAHQVWLDCMNCYVADRDDCPVCVPLDEADQAEARKLNAIEFALSEAEAAEEEKKASTPSTKTVSAPSPGVQQVDTSGLSGKSIEQLSNIRMQLYNSPEWQEYTGNFDTSQFEQYMKPVWDMRSKELDDSLSRIDACYDACSGEKFQQGGHGQECVQPCVDRAYAEGKKVTAEIERLEKAAYVEDITKMQAALAGKTPEVKGELPKGPQVDTRTGKGLTEQGRIAPSFGGYLGDAYVERPDGTKVIPGKELYLQVDDKLITGKESKVNIIFGNAGKMQLGPDTQLRVGSALLDQYYLAKGTLKTTLEGQKLEIRTPTASIFNKGTEFVTEYNETTNTTTVFLNEGNLDIISATQTINLTAGNSCTIGPDGSISSSQLVSAVWDSLSDRFYEESSNDLIFKIYAWLTFAVLMLSVVIVSIVIRREKKKQHKKEHGKNLGGFSILFGLLGIVGCLFPIIGFPLSFTSTTLARIQKLKNPTISAKIGFVLGCIGAVVNGIVFIAFFSYMGVI